MMYALTYRTELKWITQTIQGTFDLHPAESCCGIMLAELHKLVAATGDAAPQLIEEWDRCLDAAVYLSDNRDTGCREPNVDVLPLKPLRAWVPLAVDLILRNYELDPVLREEMLLIVWERLLPSM